jgi:hypothetical protein
MGKVGEKQKRTPKIKDKKQSERFKEAALELGAEEEAADLQILDKMLRVGETSELSGVPTTFVSMNRGGIVKLEDDTFWRVAGNGLEPVSAWSKGTPVIVVESGDQIWRYALKNLDNNEQIKVTRSSRF